MKTRTLEIDYAGDWDFVEEELLDGIMAVSEVRCARVTPETTAPETIVSRGVLREIEAERDAQDEKWGEQNPPDGTGGAANTMVAEQAKLDCAQAFARGVGTWRLILAEEVAEAFAEGNHILLRRELVQVAAVAVAWIEAIDRRTDDG